MNVFNTIIEKVSQGKKLFALLVDPEKSSAEHLKTLLVNPGVADVDLILLGGSTLEASSEKTLSDIRQQIDKPVVLFPGNVSQITAGVDAVFFLSLISGRNPEFLIGNHVKAAPLLKDMEVIPVAYILIDGGRVSATQEVTKTLPLPSDDIERIVDTAVAGKMLGHKMVYLEAGSGALNPISPSVIRAVREQLDVPLIVGGGLKSSADVALAYSSGADIVVVGNAFETNPALLSDIFSL